MKKFDINNTILFCINNRLTFVKVDDPKGYKIFQGESAWNYVKNHLTDSDYLCGVRVDGKYYLNHVGSYVLKVPAITYYTPQIMRKFLSSNGIEVA